MGNGWPNATLWLRNGNCLITQSQNSTPGWLQIVEQKVNKTSLWKRWSLLLENSKTSSKRRRSLWKICKNILQIFCHHTNLYIYNNKIGHHVGINSKKQIFELFGGTMCPKDQALLEYSKIFLNSSTLQLPIVSPVVIQPYNCQEFGSIAFCY